MGIPSALVTGLSGLSTSQSQIDVVGNNIANVNTVGFKSSRLDFKTQFLENFSYGSAPSNDLGGTNPMQVGLGTQAGSVSRNFGDGSLQVTGVPTNLAIQGDGFFVLKDAGQQVYSRDGTFQLNSLNQLVSSTGQLVQGYGIDSAFNVVPGILNNLTIPLGSLTVAQATQNATLAGLLNAGGNVASAVSNSTLDQPLFLSNGAGGVDAVNPPTGATLLTNVTDAAGVPMFQNGDVITLTAKEGITAPTSIAPQTLTITPATTLANLQSFLTGSLGINTSAGANGPIATVPGTTIPATGNTATLTVDGNPGMDNDITFDNNSISINRGGTNLTPFTWTKNATADGESVKTSTQVFDSLGTPLNVNVTAVLQSKNASGSVWQVYGTSPAGTATGANVQTAVGMGTLTYDTSGHLVSSTNPTITIDRTNSGAQPNLTVALNFTNTSALSSNASLLNTTKVDGSAPGTLTTFAIGNDGKISGAFSNGLSRTLGQIALATFQNNQGLIDKGSNTFIEGANSGNAVITQPQQGPAGRVVAGALELSNVDLSGEFVQLISASTAFSASSRVITTSNQLLQELLQASR